MLTNNPQAHHKGTGLSGNTAPYILNLRTRERCMVRFIPPPLHSWGKYPVYSLYKRLSGPYIWSGHFEGKRKHLLPLLGI